jgi:hypothetical protein
MDTKYITYFTTVGLYSNYTLEPLVCKTGFDEDHVPGDKKNQDAITQIGDFNRAPEIGDTFGTLCAGRYYIIFSITNIVGKNYIATA